jgi:hypothetical protein
MPHSVSDGPMQRRFFSAFTLIFAVACRYQRGLFVVLVMALNAIACTSFNVPNAAAKGELPCGS